MTSQVHWRTPIRETCFMVGARNTNSLLQCNTYLRTFKAKGHSALHWCVDPGSQVDYPAIRKHLLEHVGELAAIRLFSVNHQDPDVVGNLTFLTRESPDMTGLATEDTWRLVRHLDLNPRQMVFTNKLGEDKIKVPTGHSLRIVPTPFCHFRGALAYYDLESQVLYTGDLFAGLNKPGRVQLYGEAADWPGIAQFHQIYMPSRNAVAFAIRQIRALRPRVKVIAPQHGFVLEGDFMNDVMERLEKLPMGMDLLPKEMDERHFKAYAEVCQDLIALAAAHLDKDMILQKLQKLPKSHKLCRYFQVKRDRVELKKHGIVALPLLVEELGKGQGRGFLILMKNLALEECLRRKAPLPQMGVGLEGGHV